MQESTLFAVGCGASVGLIALSILATYILCQKIDFLCNSHNSQHLNRTFDEIDCADLNLRKMTAITLSQNTNANANANDQRRRSQSDSDILDSVALAIVSPDKPRISENVNCCELSDKSQSPDTAESVSSLSRTDDERISPLSTPKSDSKTQSGHFRNNNINVVTETNKSLNDSSSLMDQIINMIDSDSEESFYENKQEEQNGIDFRNKGRVSISRRLTSIPSSNDSLSKESTQGNEEKKNVEEDDNSDDNLSTPTITYNNSVDDYNKLHGIEAVKTKDSSSYTRKSLPITRPLDKLKEVSLESESKKKDETVETNNDNRIQVDVKQHLEIFNKTPDVKQKISNYKKRIKDLAGSSGKKPRRDSLTALKVNRMVKTKRPLFEKSKNSTS